MPLHAAPMRKAASSEHGSVANVVFLAVPFRMTSPYLPDSRTHPSLVSSRLVVIINTSLKHLYRYDEIDLALRSSLAPQTKDKIVLPVIDASDPDCSGSEEQH
ncbi:hypothetical protein B296_00007534 [Ensete ventricosum]|uniref:Uncharacterized protein n=1 Tax=Ensete ventricosum TaxID=4639 RepID=A0A427A1N8_ENSVE|nr:hypothetical protein B296_00007534 [Ensete ventricosum]